MIKVPRKVYDEMIDHAKKCYPQEACGFVAGREDRASKFLPLANREQSSVSYAMDPKEQLRVFRKLSEEKLDLLGIFHSHVASPAYPSQKDKALAFYSEVSYLIVSLSDMDRPDLKSFTITDGRESPEEIVVE